MGYKAQAPFATFADVDLKTLRSLETGQRAPRDGTRSKVEAALGWREGVITEVLDHYEIIPPDALTLEYMTQGPRKSVSRAADLTDEELIGELAYRLRSRTQKSPF